MKLDNSARINTPGVASGNWAWRAGDEKLWDRLQPEAKALRALAEKSFRWGRGKGRGRGRVRVSKG